MIDRVLWLLAYHQNERKDATEYIKVLIEGKKFNVENTVRDTNVIIKMMYERSKEYHQFNYYHEYP